MFLKKIWKELNSSYKHYLELQMVVNINTLALFFFDTNITNVHVININVCVLSCQPRVTVTSCLVYKVIRDLESIDHLCINPIRMIGFIHKRSIDSRKLKLSVHVSVYLALVNKALRHCHSWLARPVCVCKIWWFSSTEGKNKMFQIERWEGLTDWKQHTLPKTLFCTGKTMIYLRWSIRHHRLSLLELWKLLIV